MPHRQRQPRHPPPRAPQPHWGVKWQLAQGFTLVEVLVSILILAFGLLGVAGLQAVSLKFGREAHYQSVASRLAREYVELVESHVIIREANDQSVNPSDYAIVPNARALSDSDGSAVPAANCMTTACDLLQLQQWYRLDWLGRVQRALPGAVVQVCLQDDPYESNGLPKEWTDCTGTGKTLAIKIGWRTTTSTNDSATGARTNQVTEGRERRPVIVATYYFR